jgi:hypothetical protein
MQGKEFVFFEKTAKRRDRPVSLIRLRRIARLRQSRFSLLVLLFERYRKVKCDPARQLPFFELVSVFCAIFP